MAKKSRGSASLLNNLWTLWTLWTNVPSVYFFRKVSIFSGKNLWNYSQICIYQKMFVSFIPQGNSGTSHSALGSQWLIPLHLISGRPRPLLSPFEHSSLGTPYEKILLILNNFVPLFGYFKISSYLCSRIRTCPPYEVALNHIAHVM